MWTDFSVVANLSSATEEANSPGVAPASIGASLALASRSAVKEVM